MQITVQEALDLLTSSGQPFLELFKHGSLSVEIYKPEEEDLQQPHDKDEIYIVLSGRGEFFNGGLVTQFEAGDFLFVPAGIEHRFLNFTEDFFTWVIFYGPKGGEAGEDT